MTFKMRTKRKYRLRIGKDGPLGQFAEVRQVHHVAHLRSAQRILRKGVIPGRQVDDQSRLDVHDLAVCWLAPNQWQESLFGTVQFTFDFEDILRDRRIYWVEGVEGRGMDTCRLLITAADVTGLPVQPYDPETTKGPLRRFGRRWFRKDSLHLELMFEGELSLTDCRKVVTVGHRRDRCKGTCGEVGRSASDTAARLLAGLMTGRYSLPAPSYVDAGRASALVHAGWFGLLKALDLLEADPDGSIKGRERVDETVRKALRKLSRGNAAAAAEKVMKIAGERRVRSSLRRLLQRGAGIRLGHPGDTVINFAAPHHFRLRRRYLNERRLSGSAAGQANDRNWGA